MTVPAVAVEIVVGFHVPATPLFEVVGKAAGAAPTQYGPNPVKVGVVDGFTVMLMVVVVAHCPAVGVNV